MQHYDHLTVVSSSSWVSRDLASADTFEIRATVGLDIPAMDGTALWCSGSWAMRLLKSGRSHPFLSAGPDWLSRVPERFLRRRVWTGTLDALESAHGPHKAFYKLSEHKHALAPAGPAEGPQAFLEMVSAAFGHPGLQDGGGAGVGGLHCTWSELMDYRREYRCFIAHGKVTAASEYIRRVPGIHGADVEITWDAYTHGGYPDTAEAAAFAQEVADAMGADQPPGYSLDVGTDAAGNYSVIEANAAWSSGIYNAPRAGVIESLLASQEPGYDDWLWRPDELFFSRSRPLPAP